MNTDLENTLDRLPKIVEAAEEFCVVGNVFKMKDIVPKIQELFPVNLSGNDAEKAMGILQKLCNALGNVDEREVKNQKEELLRFLATKGVLLE